ncbi:FtsX-like permease family protein [Streptomyces sp. NPDC018031]|uniref:ABC transporter permease n=1 Tax=Streptomyces sp. NPDC018031 TaxID=3365033 RepID=UPI0037B93D0A
MIALATVKERRTALAGSFLSLCLGVAILTMSALILFSDGVGVPARYAGAPVVVQSTQGRDQPGGFQERAPWSSARTAELTRRLAAVPGVRRAVPDRSFYAQAVVGTAPVDRQAKGERQGHGWSSAALGPYRLTAGRPPRAPGEVALDRALGPRPGDRVTLLTARGPAPFTVSGTVDGPGYYLTDARAAELSGGVRTIGLLTERGADHAAVAAAAARATDGTGRALTGGERRKLAPAQDARTRWIGGQVLTAMAVLSAFVTLFVVASTFAFTVSRRRRELGLLRAVGATPGQVRRMLLAEALVVGAAGAGAGVPLGAVLAPALAGLLADTGFLPAGFVVDPRPWVLAAAFATGLGAAVAAVRSASRRAARTGPLDALREAEADDRPMSRARLLTGCAFTALGGAACLAAVFADPADLVTLALATAVGLITGVTLLVPGILPPVVRAATRPLTRWGGATGTLVRETMLTAVRRTASTTAPVLATIAFVVLITGNTQTSAHSHTARDTASVRAEAAVIADGTPGLSDAAADAVDGSPVLPTTVHGGRDRVAIEGAGVEPESFTAVHHRLEVVSGSLSALRAADTMAVSRSVLTTLDGTVGGTVDLTFEDGRTARLRVVAVLTDASAPYGVLLTRAAVRAHDPSALTEVVHRTGAAPADLPAALGAREISVASHAGRADAEEDRLVWVFTLLLVGLSAGYTGVAVGNTLLMATADRVPDFRVLRLSGATDRQVLWTVAGETTIVVALGTALGGLVALPSLLGIRAGLSASLGVPVDLVVPWTPVLAAVAGTFALALAASLLPARAALRRALA